MSDSITKKRLTTLMDQCLPEHKSINNSWELSMKQGDPRCYTKPLSMNYQRINLNADVNHIQKQGLKADNSNIYECTCLAIENCDRDQYSSRLIIKNAAINKTKFLITIGLATDETLTKLKQIKIKRIKDPKQPIIRPKQVDEILNLISASNRDSYQKDLDITLALTLFHTGMRVSELANLKISDIDLEKNRIYINCSKGGKSRIIAINKDLKPTLEKYIKEIRPT